jgi:CHAT domain-containing protein
VLSLAVPEIGGDSGAGMFTRSSDPWIEGLRLGPLPRASSEASRLVRSVGGASRLVLGAEASEHFLKKADLSRFGILHFAAHAVVDYEHPERSAVILAPGSESEDGFLQMRDIVPLDLEGKVILLSACRSASGTVLRGEGMQGLSRAFFQAGARAVVGNMWPLHDDEAESLMGDLSRKIAEGASLAEAVSATRMSRMRAGDPAAVWANLVVLGNADLVPVPDGRPGGRELPSWAVPVFLALMLLGFAGFAFLRRRG